MYPRRDLNPHAQKEHRILSPACLPIPPLGQLSAGQADNKRSLVIRSFCGLALFELSFNVKFVASWISLCWSLWEVLTILSRTQLLRSMFSYSRKYWSELRYFQFVWELRLCLERAMRFELTTLTLARLCSTPELRPLISTFHPSFWAGDKFNKYFNKWKYET